MAGGGGGCAALALTPNVGQQPFRLRLGSQPLTLGCYLNPEGCPAPHTPAPRNPNPTASGGQRRHHLSSDGQLVWLQSRENDVTTATDSDVVITCGAESNTENLSWNIGKLYSLRSVRSCCVSTDPDPTRNHQQPGVRASR